MSNSTEFLRRIRYMQRLLKDYNDMAILLKSMEENQKVLNIIYDVKYYTNVKKRKDQLGEKIDRINSLLSVIEM